MKQNELNRLVALRTGEAIAEIAHRGFSLADAIAPDSDIPTIDWDLEDVRRNTALFPDRQAEVA